MLDCSPVPQNPSKTRQNIDRIDGEVSRILEQLNTLRVDPCIVNGAPCDRIKVRDHLAYIQLSVRAARDFLTVDATMSDLLLKEAAFVLENIPHNS